MLIRGVSRRMLSSDRLKKIVWGKTMMSVVCRREKRMKTISGEKKEIALLFPRQGLACTLLFFCCCRNETLLLLQIRLKKKSKIAEKCMLAKTTGRTHRERKSGMDEGMDCSTFQEKRACASLYPSFLETLFFMSLIIPFIPLFVPRFFLLSLQSVLYTFSPQPFQHFFLLLRLCMFFVSLLHRQLHLLCS